LFFLDEKLLFHRNQLVEIFIQLHSIPLHFKNGWMGLSEGFFDPLVFMLVKYHGYLSRLTYGNMLFMTITHAFLIQL